MFGDSSTCTQSIFDWISFHEAKIGLKAYTAKTNFLPSLRCRWLTAHHQRSANHKFIIVQILMISYSVEVTWINNTRRSFWSVHCEHAVKSKSKDSWRYRTVVLRLPSSSVVDCNSLNIYHGADLSLQTLSSVKCFEWCCLLGDNPKKGTSVIKTDFITWV